MPHIVLGVCVLIVVAFLFFPVETCCAARSRSHASERLQRPVAIGRLDVSPGWTTRVVLEGVTVGNATWSQTAADGRISANDLHVPAAIAVSPYAHDHPSRGARRAARKECRWRLELELRPTEERSRARTIGSIDIERGRVALRRPDARCQHRKCAANDPGTRRREADARVLGQGNAAQ
jgi:hypothetical protein